MDFGDFGLFFFIVALFLVLFLVLFFPRRPRYFSTNPVGFVFVAFPQSCPFQIQELSVFTEYSYL